MTRARRVCFPFVGDSVGGSHISTLLLVDELAAHGFRPLVVLHEEGPLAAHLRERRTPFRLRPVSRYVAPPFDRPQCVKAVRRTAPGLAGFLFRHRIHIVHTNDLRMHGTWVTPAWLAGARFVWHQRTENFGGSRRKRSFAAAAHRIVCISAFTAEGLPPLLRPRAETVVNPFDTDSSPPDREKARSELRAELGLPESTRLVGFFGNFLERKRPLLFVEAAARVRQGADFPIVFPMFGEERGELGAAVRRRAGELGLGDDLRLLGFRHPAEPWMAACDVVLATAEEEPFGRTLVEAMLAGTPVVATRSGAHPEIVRDGENGRLVGETSEDLARATLDLLRAPERAIALAERAGAEARRDYSVEAHVARMVELYGEVLDAPARLSRPGR